MKISMSRCVCAALAVCVRVFEFKKVNQNPFAPHSVPLINLNQTLITVQFLRFCISNTHSTLVDQRQNFYTHASGFLVKIVFSLYFLRSFSFAHSVSEREGAQCAIMFCCVLLFVVRTLLVIPLNLAGKHEICVAQSLLTILNRTSNGSYNTSPNAYIRIICAILMRYLQIFFLSTLSTSFSF